MATGASTLNARTEHELTITLPNHTGMVTGRRIEAATGGHGVTWNDDRRRPATVQAAAGRRIESVFTSIHDAGGNTALFASKTKFTLWKRSWPLSIDTTRIRLDNAVLTRSVRRDLVDHTRAFRFVHLSLPDAVGHDKGFMSKAYLRAVQRVDALVGEIVGAVRPTPCAPAAPRSSSPATTAAGARTTPTPPSWPTTASPSWWPARAWRSGADLYDLNADDYRDPGTRRTTYRASVQPIRNGDLANLALDLLDLDAVPGSEHNSALDLDVSLPD